MPTEQLESLSHARSLKARHAAARRELDNAMAGLTAAEAEMAAALAAGEDPAPVRKQTLRRREAVAAQEAEVATLQEAARLAHRAAQEASQVEVAARRARLHSSMDTVADEVEGGVLVLARAFRKMGALYRETESIGRTFAAAYPGVKSLAPAYSPRGKAAMELLGDLMRTRSFWTEARRLEMAAPLEEGGA
ncbi:MAG: hypothetical protein H3C30_16220 [Candidatus Hydrogenedentes bacterium]|nr:hypothetical protein [Candidatus Hydrogenedentota bacterium]